MRDIYTPEHLDFLRVGYQKMRVPALTEAFNRKFGTDKSHQQMKSTLQNHKIRCGRKPGFTKGENFLSWTPEQAQFLVDNCQILSRKELTEAFNGRFGLCKQVSQVKSFINNRKIQTGRTGCFENGHKPWNQGTIGQGLTGPNSGSFEKGHVPANVKPLGHERICSKDGYILIKVAEPNPYTGAMTRYKAKHIVVFEQQKGPVPDGMIVSFIDGNKKNCAIENIELITKTENLYLNRHGIKDLPVELRPSMRVVAKVVTKAAALLK